MTPGWINRKQPRETRRGRGSISLAFSSSRGGCTQQRRVAGLNPFSSFLLIHPHETFPAAVFAGISDKFALASDYLQGPITVTLTAGELVLSCYQ